MKLLLLWLMLALPFRQEVELDLLAPGSSESIFSRYQNLNFQQQVILTPDGLLLRTNFRELPARALAVGLRLNREYLAALPPELRTTISALTSGVGDFSALLEKLNVFFNSQVEYTQEELPQDALSVAIGRRGHCLGFSNLSLVILEAVSLPARLVKGLYLEERGQDLEPVSHVWLEIDLPGVGSLFFDPQHQIFSQQYLLVEHDIRLDETEKFPIRLLRRGRRLSD